MTRSNSLQRLRLVHIMSTVSLLGVDLALFALGLAAARSGDVVSSYPAASDIATWVALPFALLSLASGLLLSRAAGWGLWQHSWVTFKLVTTSVLAFAVVLLLVPGLRAAAHLSVTSPGLITDAQRMRLMLAPAIAALLLTVNVVLGVYKPTRRASRMRNPGNASTQVNAHV